MAQDDSLYLRGAVIDGPYKTTVVENAELLVLETGDAEYPVSLVLDVKNNDGVSARQLVDKYDVAGSPPKVESIFFYPVQDVKNVFVLVSWEINHRGMGAYGTLYQVYAYARHSNGKLIPNQLIQANRYLSGIDGFSDGRKSPLGCRRRTHRPARNKSGGSLYSAPRCKAIPSTCSAGFLDLNGGLFQGI